MRVKQFPVNPFEMNCYVYYDENTHDGILIDPGAYTNEERKRIKDFIVEEGISIKLIVNTHGHLDHILGNKWAKDTFRVPVIMHEGDNELIEMAWQQASLFGINIDDVPSIDMFLNEGDEINAGSGILKVIHTPGHSPGSVCLVDDKNKLIISADSVFKGSIGRTDLWKGDMEVLLNSIHEKILAYPDDYKLYPGHYEATTVGDEKVYNPFLNEKMV